MDYGHAITNQYYRAHEIEDDDFSRLVGSVVDWEEFLDTITLPGSYWSYHTQPLTMLKHMENRLLNRDIRIWFQIVNHRFMPMTHTLTVTPE